MPKMSKLLLAALAASPLLSAIPAEALPTGDRLNVFVEGNRVGTWVLRHRVVDTGDTCRYTGMWRSVNGPPLSRTTLLRIDEHKAGNDFDCEVNRRTFFDTLVEAAPGTYRGFDEFGQQTRITNLIAGEDSGGRLVGIISFASISDVQNLEVR